MPRALGRCFGLRESCLILSHCSDSRGHCQNIRQCGGLVKFLIRRSGLQCPRRSTSRFAGTSGLERAALVAWLACGLRSLTKTCQNNKRGEPRNFHQPDTPCVLREGTQCCVTTPAAPALPSQREPCFFSVHFLPGKNETFGLVEFLRFKAGGTWPIICTVNYLTYIGRGHGRCGSRIETIFLPEGME